MVCSRDHPFHSTKRLSSLTILSLVLLPKTQFDVILISKADTVFHLGVLGQQESRQLQSDQVRLSNYCSTLRSPLHRQFILSSGFASQRPFLLDIIMVHPDLSSEFVWSCRNVWQGYINLASRPSSTHTRSLESKLSAC